MEKVMGIDELLKDIPDKKEFSNTTSKQFKKDLYEILEDGNANLCTCLEVGTHHGYTTRILSHIFKTVVTLDNKPENHIIAKELNKDRDNIVYITEDVYWNTWDNFKLPPYQVAFIDCGHNFHEVISDTMNCIKHCKNDSLLFIYDDFGNPAPTNGIGMVVRGYIDSKFLEYKRELGEGEGYTYGTGKGIRTLDNYEGVICLWEKK